MHHYRCNVPCSINTLQPLSKEVSVFSPTKYLFQPKSGSLTSQLPRSGRLFGVSSQADLRPQLGNAREPFRASGSAQSRRSPPCRDVRDRFAAFCSSAASHSTRVWVTTRRPLAGRTTNIDQDERLIGRERPLQGIQCPRLRFFLIFRTQRQCRR